MSDDYLWDKSGPADPEVERLENLLLEFRHTGPAPEFPVSERRQPLGWLFTWRPRVIWAAAAMVLLTAGLWYAARFSRPGWEVARLEGTPRVGSRKISAAGRLAVGESLETDNVSRAKIKVGIIGEVEVDPNTQVRLLRARPTEHRLALDQGIMRAAIWAPPRLFFVNTPSAVAVDLGCRYSLRVDSTGAGLLHVTYGWVAFDHHGRESFVPANALCATRPDVGPGTPYFEDASPALRAALLEFDFGSGNAETRAAALNTVLAGARRRDALTLWHLLSRAGEAERASVYDRLVELVPPPAGVTREGVLHGAGEMQRRMLDLWWDVLGMGDTSWWRMWKGPVPGR